MNQKIIESLAAIEAEVSKRDGNIGLDNNALATLATAKALFTEADGARPPKAAPAKSASSAKSAD